MPVQSSTSKWYTKTMNNAPKWIVMARQWPGSSPVPCKDAEGHVKRFSDEASAQAYAKTCRDQISPHGACRPHYYATEG